MLRFIFGGVLALGLTPPLGAATLSEGEIAAWLVAQGGVTKDEAGQVVSVDLTSTWITDVDLAKIGHLSHLRQLNLSHTKITDIGLEHLKSLENVSGLNLSYAEHVTDDGVAHLKDWKNLEHLNLRGSKVTSRILEYLARFTGLKSLDLAFTGVTDDGFEHLSSLDGLEKLACGGNRLTGAALPLLKLLPSLVHLDVGGIQRVDSGLWGLPLTEANLKSLGELTKLEALDLGGATITDVGADRPGRSDAERSELRGLSMLEGLVNLEALDLSRQPVSAEGLEVLKTMPRLRQLNLGQVRRLDDTVVPLLLKMQQLEAVYLPETSISDHGLDQLREMKHLKILYIGGSNVTADGIGRFRQARPECRVSWWEKPSGLDVEENTAQ